MSSQAAEPRGVREARTTHAMVYMHANLSTVGSSSGQRSVVAGAAGHAYMAVRERQEQRRREAMAS